VIEFILHLAVSAALLLALGALVNGIEVRDGKAALFGALALGLANAVIRPVLLALTLPVTLLTLGLFVFVVNGIMLMLAAALVDGFEVEGFGSAVWGAVVLALMNLAIGVFF